MMQASEVIAWLQALDDDALVAIDEGGTALITIDEDGVACGDYIAVGGAPDDPTADADIEPPTQHAVVEVEE